MKSKLTTLFLGVLFLWGSLFSYCQESYSSKALQIKAATETIHVAIAQKFAFEERELTAFPAAILVNFAQAKAYLWHQTREYLSPSIHKSVKTYIVFRTLRN